MITINNNIVKIDTVNTSYIMRANIGSYVEHIYYGKKLSDNYNIDAIALQQGSGQGTATFTMDGKKKMWVNNSCYEHSNVGRGDYRESMFDLQFSDTSVVHDFTFTSWKIMDECYYVPNLASSHNKSQTLAITLEDKARGLVLEMYYSTFYDCDVIVRSNKLINNGQDCITINRIMSNQLDLSTSDYSVDTLDGTWARERYINTTKLNCGTMLIDSKTGVSSNQHNPYIVLKQNKCNDNYGNCYGFNLIYSGNHAEYVEVTPLGKTRVLHGINPHSLSWKLAPQESFDTPEATMCYSGIGANNLTQQYHNFVNNHIVRGQWANKQRPVLINNWEATYFNFTQKKILELAKQAHGLGVELFVLDDGWFSNRTNDTRGLGDWTVNKSRLPDGIEGLATKINRIGLNFGIWVEPEMVNPDSNLYRAHPEWVVSHPSYTPLQTRNQLSLDLSNKEVCDYIIDSMSEIFKTPNLSYVKWDYNRNITECTSPTLSDQGTFNHKYTMGLYYILDTLTSKFPHLLFESCASGGNRVDLGMLCYMPQYWASDNTDSFDRVRIQEGTLTGYPQSTMGCHVSASPNHQTLRTSAIDTRFNTACIGAFGYELDLTELSNNDCKAIKNQIKWYKKYRDTLQFGTYYRTNSIFNDGKSSWVVVNKDKTQAVANTTNGIATTIPGQEYLPIMGLDDNRTYNIKTRQQIYSVKQFGSLINMISPVHIKEDGKLSQFIEDNLALLKSECQDYTIGGDALNTAGMALCIQWSSTGLDNTVRVMGDFGNRVYGIDEVKQ